jgi:hypothetical protein
MSRSEVRVEDPTRLADIAESALLLRDLGARRVRPDDGLRPISSPPPSHGHGSTRPAAGWCAPSVDCSADWWSTTRASWAAKPRQASGLSAKARVDIAIASNGSTRAEGSAGVRLDLAGIPGQSTTSSSPATSSPQTRTPKCPRQPRRSVGKHLPAVVAPGRTDADDQSRCPAISESRLARSCMRSAAACW